MNGILAKHVWECLGRTRVLSYRGTEKWDPREARMGVSSEGPYFEPPIICINMELYPYKME